MARSHFSSQALVLIVISIAINMIGGQLEIGRAHV